MIKTKAKEQKTNLDVSAYSGKWVGILNYEVIENADTLDDLMNKLKKRKLQDKAAVLLVPREDEGPYVLIFL
jgi:hypothetical protein